MGRMIDDVSACVNQPNDSQYGQYGAEGAFQVHGFNVSLLNVK